ncbi:MAG: thioesterase [Lachnospiraceae bacterium]|nr:thioesterase [Lachnospiraceae bacterium]MCI5587400.1 thioesterase [Lachnospiraceae bacterium]
MYTFDSRIRYSETDKDGRLSLNGIINYMQDCTNFQSEDIGVGIDFLNERQVMWVLNSWQIVIDDYPFMGEDITIGTQSYGYEKMFGYRNFLITKQDGSRVAVANSVWVLMDLKKKRPMIITPEYGDVYGKYEPLEMDYAPRKIKVPEGGEEGERFKVKEYHLDTNNHVNNGQYVRMAMIASGVSKRVRELRVEYKKQAVLGDVIVPVIYKKDNETFVSLNEEDGKPYAIVQFMVDKRLDL